MKKYVLLFFLLTGTVCLLRGQETFPVNGVQDQRTRARAFTNATIFVDYQTKLENATLLIRDGKVVAAGADVSVPEGYVETDLEGKYIYPSFIDMYTNYGVPEVKRAGFSWGSQEQIQSEKDGPYNANEAIKSEYNAYEAFTVNAKEAKAWRGMGFGAVLTFRPDGLARGSSAMVTLGEDRENKVMLQDKVAAHYSFNKGSSQQDYPRSAMGYIALLRQTYLDADWYGSQPSKPFTDKSLDAWLQLQELPQIFEANNWMNTVRADKVGDEFGVQYIIKGGGDEYQRLEAIRNTGAAMIVPVDFPDAYDLENPLDAYDVSLKDMKHWELAPANLARLEEKGVAFALTAHGLKKKPQFWSNLRKAVEYGLSQEAALKALTHTPAQLTNMGDRLGSLEAGRIANFVVASGNVFDSDVTIYQNWIQGKPYVINDMNAPDLSGNYVLAFNEESYDLQISGKPGKNQAKIQLNDTTDVKVKLAVEEEMVNLSFKLDDEKAESKTVALSGWISGNNLAGMGQMPDGNWMQWRADYKSAPEQDEPEKGEDQEDDTPELGEVIYPFAAYGAPSLPEQEDILVTNTTVWTMEEEGILRNVDVLLQDGKIARLGNNLPAGGARVIDGADKHLTPGIIDEHSHIAASSINDVATNSSMVRIGDVINSEDQEIYRALSGGVTAIQILHGSANPIGGQSGLIKLRWGGMPDEMKIEEADGFIKFALGENVKRSRSSNSIRYPQTRMGVEQVFVDAFTQAREYEKKWAAYNALSKAEKAGAVKPRQDLAMEAMLEVLRGERFISCHSYRQSEINMLMKVAERFDFTVNTFTHIMEGYKVADKMAEHGAAGSTFSDWWAYKWEVRYAIPYNATIMAREGVNTAINSDDAEMMRRLNQEAAKTIKYGGLDEYEAMKMVTINPAKMLHLDDRMGSIKEGKDADVVLWSDHPLSIYARAEKTIVDGKVYYDLEEDQQRKAAIARERGRLTQKMREAKANGGRTRPTRPTFRHHWHCEDVATYRGKE